MLHVMLCYISVPGSFGGEVVSSGGSSMLTTNWPVTPLAEHKYTPLSSSCADGMSRIPVEGRKREIEREGGGG